MSSPKNISILDYTYDLPDERIALHPLQQRDLSKLLIWKEGKIAEDRFSNIANHIPEKCLLIFNNSKVINARIRFTKTTGSTIEIFCLEPAGTIQDYAVVMNQKGFSQWKCFIGGVAKWKEEFLIKEIKHNNIFIQLKAKIIEKLNDAYVVAFEWTPLSISFAELLMEVGDIPLPPYIKRKTGIEDSDRYQTIYAKEEGSVAAPTAGLHFSENIFNQLSAKNIQKAEVSLHVGAGTFKPVKAETMEGHEMHAEWIDVSQSTIQSLMEQQDPVVAVGTTSLRTIESLYWMGVKTHLDPDLLLPDIKQWDVYEEVMQKSEISKRLAFQSLLNWMAKNQKSHLFTQTQLLITPGYKFKVANALITNFHQPQSTLLLLVAAAIGEEWRKCYDYALTNDFRFLSYGDGSLIFLINPNK
jgi:S-adenosylmethionine:tRNA ribosyltransferase-isomerase